ncbi:type II toxin-antitoxin system RelE/ParE family toxin [Rudaea sp.]|uniref:type II toxin-antitoxin system RelE/ParE family toxin n=1 Tax=Rudaea sp. TaxID=2136325 RepID=UPI0039E462B4
MKRNAISKTRRFGEREGSPALAARFIAEFHPLARLLLDHPDIGTPRTAGRRGFATAVFPFTVIYRQVEDGIRVLVVKHDRRRPGYGERRR